MIVRCFGRRAYGHVMDGGTGSAYAWRRSSEGRIGMGSSAITSNSERILVSGTVTDSGCRAHPIEVAHDDAFAFNIFWRVDVRCEV